MARWTFFGRIHPERFPLNFGPIPDWTSRALDLCYRIGFRIVNGQVIATVAVDEGHVDEATMPTLRNLVENDIRVATDLAGFQWGGSFDVDISSAVSDEGTTVVFGSTIPILTHKRQGQSNSVESGLFFDAVNSIPARMVLANFRQAIRNPVDTAFFCYRAIEAMMQDVKTPDERGKRLSNSQEGVVWERLRNFLHIDRTALNAIKAHANDPRHGRVSQITDAERAKVFTLTDDIIRRYLTFLRARTPLSASDFSLLTHP